MILFPISVDQFFPFLICSFAAGIILGAIYEIFRLRRMAISFTRAGKAGIADTVITALEDVIFLIFCAVVMILIAYKLNYGIPRWYSYTAAILGVILWRRTAGRLVLKLADKIISLVKRVLKTVFGRILLFPIRCVLKFIGKQILKIENNRAKAYTAACQIRILDRIYKE
jgi:spore cortex biosynthesis protein YabQ